jgi:hypothetical protein
MLKNFFRKYLSMNQRENRFRVSHGLEQVKLRFNNFWGEGVKGLAVGGGGRGGGKRI